jgi:2-keto-4-pentenoate hydratase/2-oxohepta-3-ene-1,7-dioic acid hydratase in catechol pathway
MVGKRHASAEITAKLAQANELAAKGKTQREISKVLGVSIMTYHRWRKMLNAEEPAHVPGGSAPEIRPGKSSHASSVAIGEVADHPYPLLTKNYHHEVELVAALKSGGTNIPPEKALDHVYGYALGLDMTRRDLQNGMAAEKKPWEIGKSFDHAAVIGPIHPVAKVGHLAKGAISLAVNGTARQNSDLEKMIWSVAEQIAKLSEAFELKAGDIIYSGTPENVGPVVKGDVLLCKLDGLPDMSIRIV